MPLQNRVDPFGAIHVTAARGALTGNRGGCMHDNDQQLVRRWATKAWITCLLEFKGRKRALMQPGLYTELFFLDEATALAAGHRPCGECRRFDYQRFKQAFSGVVAPTTGPMAASAMDAILHAERTRPDRASTTARAVADGVMVELDGQPWLELGDELLAWTFDGYTNRHPADDTEVSVLTPPTTVAVIRAGYRVEVHASAAGSAG